MSDAVLGKRYVLGQWQPTHPPSDFTQSKIDITVMPIFDVADVGAPDWFIEGCC